MNVATNTPFPSCKSLDSGTYLGSTVILTQNDHSRRWFIMASLVPVAPVEEDAKRQEEIVSTPNHAYNSSSVTKRDLSVNLIFCLFLTTVFRRRAMPMHIVSVPPASLVAPYNCSRPGNIIQVFWGGN